MIAGAAIWIDGARARDAVVPIADRGFLYGHQVFEAIRVYGGVPFALEAHVARLLRSASRVEIDPAIDAGALVGEIAACVKEAEIPEAYVRVVLTAGEGTPGLAGDERLVARRIVTVAPVRPPSIALHRDGVAALVVDGISDAEVAGVLGAKVGGYLASVLATRAARRVGAHEAIFVARDRAGRAQVLEGASSNVFAVVEGIVRTPPIDRALSGITRQAIVTLARARGERVEEAPLSLDELLGAREVFVTSSIRELLSVVAVHVAAPGGALGRRVVGDGRPGAIARALHAALRAHVGAVSLDFPPYFPP